MENHHWLIIILVILLCVVIFQFVYCIETFDTTQQNKTLDNTPYLYIFISKGCPHCVTFIQEKYPVLEKAIADTKTNIKLKIIYADEDPTNLFEKFGVRQVPTFFCVKGDKKVKVEQIDPKSLIEQFNSM